MQSEMEKLVKEQQRTNELLEVLRKKGTLEIKDINSLGFTKLEQMELQNRVTGYIGKDSDDLELLLEAEAFFAGRALKNMQRCCIWLIL